MRYLSCVAYSPSSKPERGFSLVEMAVVLTIVALLLGGLLPTISGQIEQQRRNETRKYMAEVRDALLGYAIANKRLPCPATSSNGIAQATCTTTAQQIGWLPYNDLGVPDKDAYGGVLVYAVTKEFASSAVPFTLGTVGSPNTMRICTSETCATNLASNAVAVIASRGANWSGTPTGDEVGNTDGDTDFVSHDLVQNSFDDLVVWLSPSTLFSRMVAAGQLP